MSESARIGIRADADHADQAVRPPFRRDGELQALAVRIGPPGLEDKSPGIVRVIRMRNSRRHLRDRFLTGEAYDGLRIRKAGPAQPQAAGLEAENIVTGEVGKHRLAPIRSGPPWALEMTKGRWTSHLPCRFRIGAWPLGPDWSFRSAGSV